LLTLIKVLLPPGLSFSIDALDQRATITGISA
jgi:hypothetical protein